MARRRNMLGLLISGSLLGATVVAGVPATQAFTQTPATIFINEIHYDNDGTDSGEAIEIAGPAGTDLTGWSIVLYNGGNGAAYDTDALSGTIPNQQNGYGTVVVNYPSNGIQNGSPDGVALVNGTTVVQFLSYEGGFAGVGGPANALSSTDIGVAETGSTPVGQSLQLTGAGTTYQSFAWSAPAASTFGAINTGQSFGATGGTPTPVPPTPTPEPIDITTIGAVQGVVADDANGDAVRSPFVGQDVTIQGVIYQKTVSLTSSGVTNYGFFIQNTAATDDDNALTSDGIFVFQNRFPDLIGGYTPQVGDEVVIQGRVSEFFNLTQLSSARLVEVVRSGVDLSAEIAAFEVNPPADLAESRRYWERREGMRAQVPSDSIVTAGRSVFSGTADGEVWAIRGDSKVAQREDPYARRVFRDPHPLDDIQDQLFDNGNGYRFIMGSLGIKATENDPTALIAPARTFDTIANSPIGGVFYSFNKYQIMIGQQLALQSGANPAENAPPQQPDRSREYSVANYNLENLYDFRDDPFDGCDFATNTGCPGVRPPFDYVPASAADYEARLRDIAQQIVVDLYAPEIILVQEAEDQDICTVVNGDFACGAINNADGRPDTLQELTTVIADEYGVAYNAAYDRDGADDRGIVSAFLYRTDRVELLAAAEGDPVLDSTPEVEYRGAALPYNSDVQNPKALNADLPGDVDTSTGTDGSDVFTRDPQVGLFRIWRDGIGASVFTDVYAISNHFSSGPNNRVGQRTEQAAYNAEIVEALRESGAQRIVVGGDFNVFPRPDDPFTPGQPLYPSDQLGPLYEQGLTNSFDVIARELPAAAYSYTFEGQAQTLDSQFYTPELVEELVQARVAHINADWPAEFEGDDARGVSDHDPLVSRFELEVTIDRLIALVRYYEATGKITGNNTARILVDRLERAGRFQQAGNSAAYDAQLRALINQARGFAPARISQAAADALAKETQFLRDND